MVLSARFLTSVGSVNDFQYAQNVEFTEGDALDVYFMLIDTSKDISSEGFKFAGRRYAPVAGASLSVVIDNIDDARKLTRVCTQPFANDPSIWKLSVLAGDGIKGTVSLKLTLVESAKTTRGLVQGAFRIHAQAAV